MTSSNQNIYSELSSKERKLRIRTMLLEASFLNQRRAKKYMKEHKYNEALDLLNSILHVRKRYAKIPPKICSLDIASVHIDIGLILREVKLYPQAGLHFFNAWMYHYQFFGPDHELTHHLKVMWMKTSSSPSVESLINESSQNASAA